MSKRLILLTSLVLVLSLVYNVRVQAADGLLLVEYWNNIGGTTIPDLTDNANYPDSPDEQDLLTLFDRPYDRPAPNNDNYGARIRGYLHPPETGDYTFWIASDDASNLYLSTNDDPANAVLIAEIGGWCPAYDWDNTAGSDNPNQVSAPITLEGGQQYYVEAIYKEGGGGDGFAAAWQGPGIPDRVVISGDYLSSVALPASLLVSRNPNPADGAIDADTTSLEWVAGPTAVSSKVYLSTDATIEESDLVEETAMTILLTTLDPGMTYYWRVDAVDADGAVYEGDLWSFSTLPLEAHFPSPEDGAKRVESGTTLSWTAGKGVIMHDVYFGTDEAAVAAGDPSTFKGKVMVTSFDPGPLELFTTYYWKIDEFSVTGTNPGPVWSFSSPNVIIIQSGDATLDYDNTADPFVSELVYDVPADLRRGGVGDLTLRFKGAAPSGVTLDEATGTYTVTGNGHDIWDNADDFHFAYRELTGDAVMVARVVDNGTGSSGWAKGGVMVRQSTEGGSQHAMTVITGGEGSGGAFQWRPAADGSSSSVHDPSPAVGPPYWVKIERVGNDFTGYLSPDGETWTQQGDTTTVEMTDPVLIGLCVTSHTTGELRTFTFDNVGIDGDISADTMSMDVGDDPGGNAPAPIYVTLEDSSGATATVTHGNPAATNIESSRQWTIPLDKFAGVDARSAAKLYIGVGNGQPGGTGSITISDVFVVKPAGAANIIWVDGDYDDNGDGAVDDLEWVDILTAEGYSVDNSESYIELDDDKIAALNAADLIIVSRCSNSGDYDEGDEPTQWNSITTPMIVMTAYNVRNSRWRMIDTGGQIGEMSPVMELADGTAVVAIDDTVGQSSFPDIEAVGNGTILATGDGLPWIVEWEAGVEYYDGSGQIAGGPRVFFAAGTQETDEPNVGRGEMNLTPEGLAIYLDTVKRLLPAVAKDITVPGDIVKGIPDDGDWPGAEHPALAIDDNVSTKYLHFKGDFEPDPGTGGSGIKITPLDGPTVVTGLTFTTANDVPGRDPISFELSGSNDSIDGPYTVIASGDIVDFAQADAWPRFTKNETAISIENTKAYSHYQIIFTAIRGPVGGSVNSMQIAEVELLGVLAADAPPRGTIAWVSYHAADDEPHADAAAVGFTMAPDIEYTDLLKANGYEVVRVLTSQSPDVEFLNTMDLVIISRTASSGHYSGSGASLWNSVTAPMINLNGYTLRSSRLGFTDGTDMPDTTGDVRLAVTDPGHPIFAGIALTDGVMDNLYAEGAVPLPTDGTISRGVSINNNNLDEEGTVLATIAEVSADTGPVGGIVIAELPAGATLQNSSGSPDDVLGGPRLIFLTGSREPSGVTGGQAAALYDLYPDGEKMFLNAVDYMLNPPSAAAAGFSDDFDRADGDLGNDWATQADGTIEVKIVGNEVLIAGEQATDWARSGLSRDVGDETIVSFDFKGDDSFNVHVRLDDAATDAFLEIYTWGGPLIHANSEDGGWPGWTDIVGSEVIAGEYNNLVLEQVGTDFIVTLNGVEVATLTNAALTDIGSVLFSSDAAAGTVGSIRIDNVVLSGP